VLGFLGLGSNVGDRRAQLQAAVDALAARGVRVLASSSVYDTDPVGLVPDQRPFLNACVRIETGLGPEQLLGVCKDVERELGRDLEGGVRHGPRPIDVDLLLLGGQRYASDRLVLPHPQATSRRFVLIPLLELEFELEAPGGERLSDALARLPLDEGVRHAGEPLELPQATAGSNSGAIDPAGTSPG
jgi:2-amino-4-hydroxy-6-hydroxymethyldihydropteridine diphosphokinase